jgi:outer membrane protein OmpA-like peptidoglycan-associated protein
MKLISLITFCSVICCQAFSQDTKNSKSAFIKKANEYFNAYRFADAKKIYNELLFDYKIDVDNNIDVYRNASITGIKTQDYWFAEKVNEKIKSSKNKNFEDVYNIFMLHLFLGQYEKLDDDLDSELVKQANGPKKEILNAYKKEKPWLSLTKDTLGSSIVYATFNSGEGDFGPVIHPNGISFSSKRNHSIKKSVLDNGNYLDQFLFDTNSNSLSEIKNTQTKFHDGASFYDKENQIWYYSKNHKAEKTNALTTTGIFIYDEKTEKEISFPYNDKAYFLAQPFYSNSTKTLYFSSNLPGSIGKADLWKSEFKNGEWSQPENLGNTINTIEDEMFPHIFEDNFYFASNGHLGLGGLDVFVSQFKASKFEKPLNLGYPLNYYGDDFSLVLKEDGKNGFYTNNRKDFLFVDHIYSVTLHDLEINFMATVLENLVDKLPIAKLQVVVKDENNKEIAKLITDEKGIFHFKAKKDKKYTFYLGNEDYENHEEIFSTSKLSSKDTVKREILLNPKNIQFVAKVKEKETGDVLANSSIQIIDKKTKKIISLQSDENGEIAIKIPRNRSFEILTTKKGFIDNFDSISTVTKDKEITKNIVLEKIKAGVTFKIENVFYDFAKASLREESKAELDKLADFLLKNDNINVELSSHTDSRGSDAANKKLSQARAQSCVDYLITKGVKKQNIVAKGYGESKLVNRCKNNVKCSEEEHQANRRTEIKILSVKAEN